MKLLTGTAPGRDGSSVFVVEERRATRVANTTGDLLSVISEMLAGNDPFVSCDDAQTFDLETIIPVLPVARPGKIICLGLNYAEHAREGGYDVPDYPAMFLRASTSIVAAGAPMILPAASHTFDYEAELLAIIGRGGRHIPEATALDHIFGYTSFNDGSVRAFQRKTHQWTAGKNFDATGAVGPIVVTPEDLPPGATALSIQTRLNGRVLQKSNTSDMIFTVARTIAIVSEIMTLEPGDMIAFGTPPGVGHARTPQVWMRDGDVVEVEIEGIGICRSPIVAETTAGQIRTAAE